MISSTSNQHIKQIRKLKERKERQQSGLFFVEGLRIVTEAVQQNAVIEEIVFAPGLLNSELGQRLVEKQAANGRTVIEVSNDVFCSIASRENPQGIAAVLRQQWTDLDDIWPDKGFTWVALDAVADPGNLGTILRTLGAVGGGGVILIDHTTDPYDPTALRASMGAIFAHKLARISYDGFRAWKEARKIYLVGTSGSAELDYQEAVYPDALVFLMGSERQGLQEHQIRLCDSVVRIPMTGCSDSLNLAVATALVLYENFNQKRKGKQT